MRKFVVSDKDSLIGEAKAAYVNKARNPFTASIVRQVVSHLQESRTPSHVKVTWEEKHYRSERPPFFCFLPFYILGSPVPAVSPPSPLCTPSLLTGRVSREAEKALMLCEHCSAVTKIFLSYQRCFQHKPKRNYILATVKKINSKPKPARPPSLPIFNDNESKDRASNTLATLGWPCHCWTEKVCSGCVDGIHLTWPWVYSLCLLWLSL